MLVKWAIEGRRKTAKSKPFINVEDRHGVAATSAPTSIAGLGSEDHPRMAGSTAEPETTAQALTAQLDRFHYQSDAAMAISTEDEGDRAMRRIHAEERDTKLRDEKLLSLVAPQLVRHNSSPGRETEPSMPLTEENIEKLVHEQDGESAHSRKSSPPDADSSMVDESQSRNNSKPETLTRPGLSERRSEQTITAAHISR
jgi:hypothetical protein